MLRLTADNIKVEGNFASVDFCWYLSRPDKYPRYGENFSVFCKGCCTIDDINAGKDFDLYIGDVKFPNEFTLTMPNYEDIPEDVVGGSNVVDSAYIYQCQLIMEWVIAFAAANEITLSDVDFDIVNLIPTP